VSTETIPSTNMFCGQQINPQNQRIQARTHSLIVY
jgi:hypothetical protein